jgi:hypothetical protein
MVNRRVKKDVKGSTRRWSAVVTINFSAGKNRTEKQTKFTGG